jgi:hypothetical protein
MPVEFEKVVFNMKVGEVSDVVESEFGYHILKLTDMRAGLNELPFESVAHEISRELLLRKRAAVYDSLLSVLRTRANIDVVDPDLRYALELADSLEQARRGGNAETRRGFQAVPEPAPARPAEPAQPEPAQPERPAVATDTAAVDTTAGE